MKNPVFTNRITVKQAALLMNVSPQYIRVGLQKARFPFGYAVKMSTQWCYFISKSKFEEYTGIKVINENEQKKWDDRPGKPHLIKSKTQSK